MSFAIDFLIEEATEQFYDAIAIYDGPEPVGAVGGYFPGLPLGPAAHGASFAGKVRDALKRSREWKGMRKSK